MKIGIVYGHVASNVGDLTINRGVAGMLHQVAPDAEVHVVLRDPNEAYSDGAKAEFKEIERLTFGVLRTGRKQGPGASNDDSARLERAMEYVLEPARFIAGAGLSEERAE